MEYIERMTYFLNNKQTNSPMQIYTPQRTEMEQIQFDFRILSLTYLFYIIAGRENFLSPTLWPAIFTILSIFGGSNKLSDFCFRLRNRLQMAF